MHTNLAARAERLVEELNDIPLNHLSGVVCILEDLVKKIRDDGRSSARKSVGCSESSQQKMDRLQLLPKGLLKQVWPAERVVMGMHVCKWLHTELGFCSGKILLVGVDTEVGEGMVGQSLRLSRFQSGSVALQWWEISWASLQTLVSEVGSVVSGGARDWLVELSLSGTGDSMTDAQEAALARLVAVLGDCKALAHLALDAMWLGDVGAEKLAGVLGECKHLEHLQLRRNEIGTAGARMLAGVLGGCKKLKLLDISSNTIGDEGAGTLAEVLGGCKELESLDISDNEIGDEGAGMLGEVLGKFTSLSNLSLSHNAITEEGAYRLELWRCPALESLDLQNNKIRDLRSQVSWSDFSFCSSLTHLSLAGNPIYSSDAAEFTEEILRDFNPANVGLTHLDLSGPGIEMDANGLGRIVGALGRCPLAIQVVELEVSGMNYQQACPLRFKSRIKRGTERCWMLEFD